MKALRHLTLITAGLFCLAGCATNPVTGGQDLVLMSEKDEIAIGRQAHQQVLQEYAVYNDAELQGYVQYVGGKLAEKSHRPGLSYRFTVLDSQDVNAFALPGGWIYITRGLMSYLNSEAELAAVLGHEIGHVTARHAVRQQTASQLTSIGTAIGAAFIPGLGQAGYQLAGVLGEALLRGYGRDMELEADRLGAEYLARTNYEPDAVLNVLRTLKSQELFEVKLARSEGRNPRIYHGLFSTHPDNDTRLKEAIANARNVAPVPSPQVGRNEYLQRIEGMVYGEDTSQGIIRGRDFYHGALAFGIRFPAGWKIKNMADRVMAATPDNDAVIQVTLMPADPKLTPRDYMLEKLGLKRLGNEQKLQIHGFAAHTATALVNSGDGQRPSRMTVIYFGNYAFVLAGLSRNPGAMGSFDGRFIDTAQTFRALTPEERKATNQVQRLTLVRADAKTNFQSLASASPVQPFPEQQIRLLNGRYPQGELKPGELIKTVK